LEQELETLGRALATAQAARAELQAESERRCDGLEQELETLRPALATAQAALAEQEGRTSHLVDDNEAMQRQLYAVQEELETYFLRCQGLSNSLVAPWVSSMAPIEVRFDMRGDVDGENWYSAEADGRWAGPELVSTLNLPALGRGRYEVYLDVVDAMKPEILANMHASVNDTPVPLTRKGDRYPALIAGQFYADDVAADGKWRLRLEFPHVVSPSAGGSDDTRRLAIRVRSVKLGEAQAEIVDQREVTGDLRRLLCKSVRKIRAWSRMVS
jgi:hypothetical protein